jgi:hypothetical protein
MDINEIKKSWSEDCEIDETKLDRSSIDTAKLHSKYIGLLIDNKLKITKTKADYDEKRRKRIKYFNGQMTKEELEENGWEQYQYNKPLKSEMEDLLNGDSELNKYKIRLEYLEAMEYLLESIMSQIKSRDFQIKNIIQWKLFTAGN